MGKIGKIVFDLTTNFDPYLSKIITSDSDIIKEESINDFTWNHGQHLGKVKEAKLKVSIDFADDSIKKKKKGKELFTDYDDFPNKIEENKIDVQTPWNFSWEFHWDY